VTRKKSTPRLDSLLDRVEKLRPNKAELGKILGVDRQRVYHWVSVRSTEPGGEVTLHLLDWVEEQERKQKEKARGSVTSTARGRKTRSTHSDHETRKTSPKGRG
jgi:hypothetical protein